jgi:uncharacterized protein (TIRG00374 family)
MADKKRRFSFWLKLAVSFALIVLLIRQLDFQELGATLLGADLRLVALYVVISPLMQLTSSLKWQLFLRVKSICVGLLDLYKLYFIGHFFNYFMPSNVGGDVMRIYELKIRTDNFSDAVASVFMERMTGLAALLAFGGVAIVGNIGLLNDTRVVGALVVGGLGYAFVLWLLVHGRLIDWVLHWLQQTSFSKFAGHLQDMNRAVRSYGRTPHVWLPAAGYSVLFYLLVVGNAWIGCRAFGLEVPLSILFLIVPVVLLVATIPISIGGVGLVEWGYFTLFEQMGLPGAVGLSVALLNRSCGLLLAGFGGILYGIQGGRRRDEYAQNQ